MRTFTLFALLCLALVRTQAQVYTIWFDDSGLELDSVYPSDTWQVGTPQKALFDSAYSAPNALVTDTLVPYPVGDLEYAEFHLPVWFTGSAFLTFTHKLDIEPGEALGWVEFRSPWDTSWTRMMDNSGTWAGGEVLYSGLEGELTDSGLVYNTPIPEWSTETFDIYCIAVFGQSNERGGGLDTTMRFRFVFDGDTNSAGRDGWLIDNIIMEYQGPCSGVAELDQAMLNTYPNPVDRELRILPADMWPGPYRIEILGPTGMIAMRDRWSSSGVRTLDLSSLSNGPYILRMTSDGGQTVARIVVQH